MDMQVGTTAATEEAALRMALAGGFHGLRRLPAATEAAFRRHCQDRATLLLRQSVYGLAGLYLLVVLPIYGFSQDPARLLWVQLAMLPIGLVLAGFWLYTRLAARERHAEPVIALGLFVCLSGTLYCAMRLDGQYFGRMAAYETLYVLIVAFTILQLAPRLALPAALLAFATALLTALADGLRPSWLEMLLYFVVPLGICLVTGVMLEHAERRNFVQQWLLGHESRRLAALHAAAEAGREEQRYTAAFLTLISGQLSAEELLTRALAFLVEHTGAQVGAAYLVGPQGRLRRAAAWALTGEHLARTELAAEATLMGPALRSGQLLHLRQVQADYLPLELGMGRLPCAAVLILPIVQAGHPLAVLELGRLSPFGPADEHRAELLRTHLAYALAAARRDLPAPARA